MKKSQHNDRDIVKDNKLKIKINTNLTLDSDGVLILPDTAEWRAYMEENI